MKNLLTYRCLNLKIGRSKITKKFKNPEKQVFITLLHVLMKLWYNTN